MPFGKWLPDYGPAVQGLVTCNNLLPYNNKYFPMYGLTPLSQTVIPDTPLRIFSFTNTTKINKTFVCTPEHIYRMDGTTLTDVSISGGYHGNVYTNTWAADIFGNTVVFSNGVDALQELTPLDTATQCTALGGTPPIAQLVRMYHDHLFLGNDIESGTANPRRIFRSATGDIGTWQIVNGNGAGYQDLESWGEYVVALELIDDNLVAYMNNSIWLVYDVGAPLWFGYEKIFTGNGPISAGCVVLADNHRHYFLGYDDIYEVFGNVITPLGAGVRSVTHDINIAFAHRITSYMDQTRKLIFWSYPSTVSTGTPDKMLIYNIEEGRFTQSTISTNCIGTSFTAQMTINGLDVYGKIEDLYYPFDSFFYLAGYKQLAACDPLTAKLSYFGGPALSSKIVTGQIDLEQVSAINQIRPSLFGPTGTVVAAIRSRLNEEANFKLTTGTMNSQGLINLRATGRFIEIELDVTGDHQGIAGFYPTVYPLGRR